MTGISQKVTQNMKYPENEKKSVEKIFCKDERPVSQAFITNLHRDLIANL
jgi:hypothetical protein